MRVQSFQNCFGGESKIATRLGSHEAHFRKVGVAEHPPNERPGGSRPRAFLFARRAKLRC